MSARLPLLVATTTLAASLSGCWSSCCGPDWDSEVGDLRSWPDLSGPAMTLPISTASTTQSESPTQLIINTSTISTQRKVNERLELVTLSAGRVAAKDKKGGEQGYLIPALLSELKKSVKAARVSGESGGPLVWADQTTPYRTLSEVLFTVGQAGFERYQLVVRNRKDRLSVIRFAFARYRVDRREGASEQDHPRLGLTVTVARGGFIIADSREVWRDPKGELPTVKCKAPLVKGRCPMIFWPETSNRLARWDDPYDHAQLRALVRRAKKEYPDEREVFIRADPEISYQAVVRTLDTARGVSTEKCTGDDGCLFDRPRLAARVD